MAGSGGDLPLHPLELLTGLEELVADREGRQNGCLVGLDQGPLAPDVGDTLVHVSGARPRVIRLRVRPYRVLLAGDADRDRASPFGVVQCPAPPWGCDAGCVRR